MALLDVDNVSWGFDHPPLLDSISFQVEKGQRVCLVGRNGTGKTCLMKIIHGDLQPDSGEIRRQQGLTMGFLEQDVPQDIQGTVFDVVAQGLGETGQAIAQYHRLMDLPDTQVPDKQNQLARIHQILESRHGWELQSRIDEILSKTRLNPNDRFQDLSAGMKRRALFARALIRQPDLLLLDEPTNHLDITTITWLEDFILRHIQTLLFVTHDREFAKHIATRILELDRGRLLAYHCDYATWQRHREQALDVEQNQMIQFEKKLSQEEQWIRQGIKARRTRNEGRVRALQQMREAYRNRRQRLGNVKLQVQQAEKSGKLVIEATHIGFSYQDQPLIRDFSTVIIRGDKVGIIGPNGVGKTSLVNILLKHLDPDTGTVRHGTRLEIAYFDQLRDQIDQEKTIQENIAQGNDFITINGRKRHVIGYLKDFLFTPQRCRTPVHILSGGEKNRLLLAKLFSKPANLIVMDEPTNDLDVETLELLEEMLFEFKGTLLVISHDRAFLNNVVTRTLVFEGNAKVVEYAGGFDDWLIQIKAGDHNQAMSARKKGKGSGNQKRKTANLKPVNKLTFKEQRELEKLPERIETLESEHAQLTTVMADPGFYKNDKSEIVRVTSRLNTLETEIQNAYQRWEQLEQKEK